MSIQSENGPCRIGTAEAALSMPVVGCQGRERRTSDAEWMLGEARTWAGPAGCLLPQAARRGPRGEGFPDQRPGHKGMCGNRSESSYMMHRKARIALNLPSPGRRLGWPFSPPLPQDRTLLRLRFPDLLICTPLARPRLDLQPCFPKAGLPPLPQPPGGCFRLHYQTV